MKKVLFLCTQNACRSQIAEALTNVRLAGKIKAFSAGIQPDKVHPVAIEILKKRGIDISNATSKHMDTFKDTDLDAVVTVCDNAHDNCPNLPISCQRLHFPIKDPAKAVGSKADIINAFEKTVEVIETQLIPLLEKRLLS